MTLNLGMQGTPISIVFLCRRPAGAPDARRWAFCAPDEALIAESGGAAQGSCLSQVMWFINGTARGSKWTLLTVVASNPVRFGQQRLRHR